VAVTAARALVLVLVPLALAVGATPDAWAGPPADQVRRQLDQVVKILAEPGLKREGREPERRAKVRAFVDEIFDFTEMTRRTLAQHWQTRTEAERSEVVRLFSDLIEHVYYSKLATYSGEKIAVLGDAIDADQATVRTRIITQQGSEIPVDYRMLRRGEQWLVYDVAVEGVSLVANYRMQFNKIIQSQSYRALVDKLRSKRG
jgi:phospholipid transport system substrate-binding protein